jgi:hypothetical protein
MLLLSKTAQLKVENQVQISFRFSLVRLGNCDTEFLLFLFKFKFKKTKIKILLLSLKPVKLFIDKMDKIAQLLNILFITLAFVFTTIGTYAGL